MKFKEIIFEEEISAVGNISPDTEIVGIAIRARDVRDGYLYIVTNSEKASFDLLHLELETSPDRCFTALSIWASNVDDTPTAFVF